MAHLLVVDDEPSISELLEISFRKEGHKVEVVSNGQAAKRRLAAQVFDIVISDICMPDMNGVELLQYTKEVSPSTIFILITGVPTVDTAIDAVNFGADRYVVKGDRLLDELRPAVKRIAENQALRKEAGELRRQLRRFTGFDHIIGASPKMRDLFDLIETIAPPSTRIPRAPKLPSSPSIAAPFRKRCSNRNSSATCAVPSPEPTKIAAASF